MLTNVWFLKKLINKLQRQEYEIRNIIIKYINIKAIE